MHFYITQYIIFSQMHTYIVMLKLNRCTVIVHVVCCMGRSKCNVHVSGYLCHLHSFLAIAPFLCHVEMQRVLQLLGITAAVI